MAIPSRQIGWGTEENLLWEISKQLEQLTKVTYNAQNVITESFDPLFTDASGTTAGAVATGSYTMIAPKICFFRVYVDFASCTNFGTLQYQITLPFPSVETMRQAVVHCTKQQVLLYITLLV